MRRLILPVLGLLVVASTRMAEATPQGKAAPEPTPQTLAAAREKGLDWLAKHQAGDGSWGKTYNFAITAIACLAYLSAADEPFAGERGKALVKGLRCLLAAQKDGMFPTQKDTWIHGQGFATLALAEAYGRSLFCKTKSDLDWKEVRGAVASAVGVIQKNQSTSGGWWYHPASPDQHEGSTTVCAVQAIVSADHFGIPVDRKVLARGFEYLKKCQTREGGFNYQLGDGKNMHEGTAGGVSTLGLMKQFDTEVMIKGYRFLQKLTPAAISGGSFPYYGHFYGCMGMLLLGQEFADAKEFREGTRVYIAGVQKDVLSWQEADGSWPLKGWMKQTSGEDAAYPTAFATLILFVPEARLSVHNRKAPALPADAR